MTNQSLTAGSFALLDRLPGIHTYARKHNQKKFGSDQARFLTSFGASNRNNLPCRALAISANSVALFISNDPISALVRQSSIRSIAAMISFRRFAAISCCLKTKFCNPSSLQSHKYPNGGSGLSIKASPGSDLGAGGRFYSLADTVSRNKTLYVFLRRKEAPTQCGTENGFLVSGCPNSCGPMNEWSAKSSLPPNATTGIGPINSFITFLSASSTTRSAKESHTLAHVVTGARHEN